MEQLPTFLSYSLSAVVYFKYVLIFIGSIVEGPVLMIASGFLLSLGAFEILPLFIALVLGDLAGDVIWYYIGYYFSHKFIDKYGKFFGITKDTFEKVKTVFSRHQGKILFLSKIVMGFGIAIYVLMVAGATRVKFGKYLLLNALGSPLFVAALLFVGYRFGEVYRYLSKGLNVVFLITLVFVICLFIYNLQKYLRKKALKSL